MSHQIGGQERCTECGAVVWDGPAHRSWHIATRRSVSDVVGALQAICEALIAIRDLQELEQ